VATVKGGVTAAHRHWLGVTAVAVAFAAVCQPAFSESAPGAAPGSPASSADPWTRQVPEDVPLEIPRASERPLSVDDGPSIAVRRFDLELDAGLNAALPADERATLNALLEQRRQERAATGFTIGQMEQVANAATESLRDAGFIVAYAYVPTQEVDDGVVTISVLSGSLSKVTVRGNEVLSDKRIAAPFQNLVGRPLQRGQLETALLNLRDTPGLAPAAVLSPGEAVGTTDLTLSVREQRFEIATMVDNYGTELTGRGRGRIRFDWNNPLKRGDRLTLNVLQTFDPAKGTYGGGSYEIPVNDRGTTFGLLGDSNTFDAQVDGIDTDANSKTAAIYVRQKLKRSRDLNLDLRLEFARKEAKYNYSTVDTDFDDTLAVGSVSMDLEVVDRFLALGVNSLSVGYYHGFPDFLGSLDKDGTSGNNISSRQGNNGDLASGEFDKGVMLYQRQQLFDESNSMLFRLFGQYTGDMLTPLEQLSLGGPYTVRAYSPSEFLADKGFFTSLEYTLNISSLLKSRPTDWDLSASLFYDYSDGAKNNALQNEEGTEVLAGYGGGIQYEYRWGSGDQGIQIRAEVATPTVSYDAANGDDPQYWLRFEYFRR